MDARLSPLANQLRGMADLIDAGRIDDVAYVVTPKTGEPFMGFAIAPKRPEILAASLQELAVWVGQKEKHAAIEKARVELGLQ